MAKIIRTETKNIKSTEKEKSQFRETVIIFRAFCRALSGVLMVHWPDIAKLPVGKRQGAVEKLIHKTTKNPIPKYSYFDRKFYKFPSYLRRSAIDLSLGQVSSHLTRYSKWQIGDRKKKTDLPPTFNSTANLNPNLFKGQLIKFSKDSSEASFKIWNGSDWVWTQYIKIQGGKKIRPFAQGKRLSSSLLAFGKNIQIAMVWENNVKLLPRSEKVAAFDLGVSSIAVGAIVLEDGTVEARRFFSAARDIDRRDKGLTTISKAAKKTIGQNSKLSKGFCRHKYQKGMNRNRDISCKMAKELVEFAVVHKCTVLVFEHLKHFRPKAGGRLKQRFHGWMHRALVERVKSIAELKGLRVQFIHPAGTSKYAYDGSGEVKRDKKNRALATFANGKQYNADLNACYNIGARWHAKVLKLNSRNRKACAGGKSSSTQPRTPVTLSTLWLHAQSGRVVEGETASAVS